MVSWSSQEAVQAYGVPYWGAPYFSISAEGQVSVHPSGDEACVGLADLVHDLTAQGARAPIILRFPQIIHHRLHALRAAFARAIEAARYQGGYHGAYPIKVNQQRRVVRAVLDGGAPHGVGLEAGSKPELMIAMGMQKAGGLILCNGFKDAEYLRTALHAQALGLDVIIVIERLDELKLLLELCASSRQRPQIGLRARLRGAGSGKWAASSGDRSKFGLTSAEMLSAIEHLRRAEALEDLCLLHFHAGSQMSELEPMRRALREATRLLLELRRLGAAHLNKLDIGGGLAVDYDGSQSSGPLSMAYSLDDYAQTAVREVAELCDQAGQPHPDLLTESGRATVAHHSLMVVEVIGEDGTLHEPLRPMAPAPPPAELAAALEAVERSAGNLLEDQRALEQLNARTSALFECGAITLEQRAHAEAIERRGLAALRLRSRQGEPPMGLRELDNHLAETWYVNFSLFQSLPDHWAIDHDFPIVPLQRLNERPDHRVHLGDMTCDSDGEIRRFVGAQRINGYLPVHSLHDAPYYLGIFLVGAYQEILGDLHNLFGDPDTLEVELTAEGPVIRHQSQGNTIDDVIHQVGYRSEDLIQHIQRQGQERLRLGQLSLAKMRAITQQYRRDLMGYTYLEPTDPL